MSRRIGAFLFIISLLLIAAPQAMAAGTGPEPGLWSSITAWIFTQQRTLHEQLAGSLGQLQESGSTGVAAVLILTSFLYGVFHAAGPGHGKAVLTTYLLTHRDQIRRGVLIATASALCQGLVAILLVYGLIYLGGWLPRETSAAVGWSERISFLLVALIGALLVLRTLRSLWRQNRMRHMQRPEKIQPHNHGHVHTDGEDCTHCGHQHMPSGEQIAQVKSLRAAVGVILAIGLRPCTGAILVLILAKALSLPFAGVAAVIAMSVGTGAAVAIIAYLAIAARQKAIAFTEGRSILWGLAGNLVAIAGGTLLVAIGISLLNASFATRHPLGF